MIDSQTEELIILEAHLKLGPGYLRFRVCTVSGVSLFLFVGFMGFTLTREP